MTETLLGNHHNNRVLEIGTGSGFQAGILSALANEVYTVERIKSLYQKAKSRFEQLRLTNIYTKFDDGTLGWPEKAPFDGIIVTAASDKVPPALIEQLAESGRMIIPIATGGYAQSLQLITKQNNQIRMEELESVLFVPLLKGRV